MLHSGYLRGFASVIIEMASRGHCVHIGIGYMHEVFNKERIEKLSTSCIGKLTYSVHYPKGIHYTYTTYLELFIRRMQNYLRFFDPLYSKAFGLKERASVKPKILDSFLKYIHWNNSSIWKCIMLLRFFEKAVPIDKGIISELQQQNPDLMLITPYVDTNSLMLSWVKAAKKLKIRVMYNVYSWDNLTNKGLIQIEPEAITLWNKFQSEELKMHKISTSRVCITGSQIYDYWFENKPSESEIEFKKHLNIQEKEYILYCCSSAFIAPYEAIFFKRWSRKLRDTASVMKDAYIIIRPHPQNYKIWKNIEFSQEDRILIYPDSSEALFNEDSKEILFNAMYYAKCIIGINTSLMIEAAILNKTVFTIMDTSFNHSQEGTLHFEYLRNSGFIKISSSIENNILQLESFFMRRNETHNSNAMKFVSEFVRPCGISKSCTSILCNYIEGATSLSLISYPIPNLFVSMLFRICFASIFAIPLFALILYKNLKNVLKSA